MLFPMLPLQTNVPSLIWTLLLTSTICQLSHFKLRILPFDIASLPTSLSKMHLRPLMSLSLVLSNTTFPISETSSVSTRLKNSLARLLVSSRSSTTCVQTRVLLRLLFSFPFHIIHPRLTHPIDFLLTILTERLTPKRGFLYYAPRMALFFSSHRRHLTSCVTSYTALFLFYRTANLSIYIRLSLSTENTAWSVRRVHTYINRRYLLYFSLTLIYLILPCPWISLSLRTTLECALLCNPSSLNSLSNRCC